MLEWFTTIPGILIICGVILLVIAIVLFVLGSKKDKKVVVSQPTINDMVKPQVDTEPVIEPVSITPVEVSDSPVVEPVAETVVEPVVVTNQEISMSNDVEVTSPVNNENETVVFTEPVVDFNVQEPVAEVTDTNSVYEPTVDFTVQEEKPVTIYGGNDPLEATQALPKMDINHVPYGGEYTEAKVVEPVFEQPVPTPVVETVVNMPEVVSFSTKEVSPVVEPISIPEPVVENIQPVPTPVVEQTISPVEEL